MRILDLFCGQGGAGHGYHQAGFDVIGVDIDPQPNYPHTFIQTDALRLLRHADLRRDLGHIDAVHASPPCQRYSTATRHDARDRWPDLIDPVRQLLDDTGLPYVIENVPQAPLRADLTLCGSMFRLAVRRHRIFESNTPLTPPGDCDHKAQGTPVGVYGQHPDRRNYLRPDGTRRGTKARTVEEAQAAMGMPWADWHGCAEAIPPAYTEWIGAQLADHIRAQAAA